MKLTFLKSLRKAAALALCVAGVHSAWADTILFEGFEGSFPADNGWSVGDANSTGTAAYWDDVFTGFGSVPAHSGSWKGYCAGFGYAAGPLYQNYMTSYMRRSLDLTGYCSPVLSFWYWSPSIETCCDHLTVSVGGTIVFSNAVPTGGWTPVTIALDAWAGSVATLDFTFSSDFSVFYEGTYLDDIAVTAAPATARVYDAWWNTQDHDGDGCASGPGDLVRLYWDPDVSCSGPSLTVFEKIYYRTCGSGTWTFYTQTSPHVITGLATADQQYVDIPAGGTCSCWEYQIELYRNGQVAPDYVRNNSNDSDLGNHYEELYAQDECLATVYNAYWGPVQDHDGDGCVATANDLMRLYWDPDVVNCSGSLTVFEKIYYRQNPAGSWTLYYTTAPHVITGTATADTQYVDVPSGSGCSGWDYQIEVYRNGQVVADYTRNQSNDTDLLNHREELYTQDECLATVYNAYWGPQQDADADGCWANPGNTFRLYWDPDVVNCSGTLTVFEKIYYRSNPAGSWTLYFTTAPHVITGTATADTQFVDIPAGTPCGGWDYKIEVYRNGQAVPDYVRDQSNDTDLLNHREEYYLQDACLATVYDAWWGNQQDHDGDGCWAAPSDSFRLYWDPDVVNCSGTLSVFEKVYYRTCGSIPWTLHTTTAPHVITGTATSDQQYTDIPTGLACSCWEYKIEVYRNGEVVPDYTRDNTNDTDLANHREEVYLSDECLATVYDAYWGPVQDHDGDGCVATANNQMRLYWDPDVVNCTGTLTVFEKIYFRLNPAGSWTLYNTTTPHVITGTATADTQYVDIPAGGGCNGWDYKIEVYRDGQVVADYTRDQTNDTDLLNHREELYTQDECLVTVYDAWWGPQQDGDGDGCWANSANAFRLFWDPDVVNCSGTLSVFEKVYYRLCGSSTWTLHTTTAPHTITGTATADTQYTDIPTGTGCSCWEYKIEAYRNGQVLPDYTRDYNNDVDLANHHEELYLEDECSLSTVTVYDAWWSNQVDTDGDGCMEPTGPTGGFRLNWDPDVVGCSAPISVFEKIYWRLLPAGSWFLYTTTAPHNIVGTATSDQQYVEIPPGSGCTQYDYKVEIYRNGQVLADYTRDNTNDPDLAAHKEEALSKPVLTIRHFGSQVVLSWQTNFVGFTLQGAPTLTTVSWPTVPPPPVIVGTEYVVTNSIGVNNQFYRLYKP